MPHSYCFFQRPEGKDSPSPYLVFDHCSHLHIPLTQCAHFMAQAFAKNTVRAYLYRLVRYFTWLDQESRLAGEPAPWNRSGELVRGSVVAYFTGSLKCQIRTHSKGFYLILPTAETNKNYIKSFLAAIKHFYQIMIENREYPYTNPFSQLSINVKEHNSPSIEIPSMPLISGVREAHSTRKRLSSCYFVLEKEKWEPRIIDNPDFPALILESGVLAGWGKREVVVTRLLFETGARISEVCGLTLGDWHRRGLKQEASTFNKGSYNRRVKFLRWSNNTAKLLLQYFNGERRNLDPKGFSLEEYLRYYQKTQEELDKIPLFLTKKRGCLTPKTYRDLYWRQACEIAKIDANVHQTRHWYVTSVIRQIYSSSRDPATQEGRLQELIHYMGWRRGKDTLETYKHYFSLQSFAEVHDKFHRKLNARLQEKLKRNTFPPSKVTPLAQKVLPSESADNDLEYLYQLGGKDR